MKNKDDGIMKNLKKQSFILLLVTLLVLYLVLKDNFSQIMGLLLSMKLGYLLLAVIFIFLYWIFKSIGYDKGRKREKN